VGKFWDELFTFVFDETVLENEATPLGLGMVDGDNIVLSRKNELSRYEKDMQMFIESEPEDTLKDHSGNVLDRDPVVRSSLKMLNKRNAVHAELMRLSKRKMQQMSGGLNIVMGEPGGLPLLLKDTEPGPATPDPRLVRKAEMENCKIALMCSIYSSMQLYDMESDGFPCVTPMDEVNNINSRVCEQPGAEPYSSQAECVAELREALKQYRLEALQVRDQTQRLRNTVSKAMAGRGGLTIISNDDHREVEARLQFHDMLLEKLQMYESVCEKANKDANNDKPFNLSDLARRQCFNMRFKDQADMEQQGYTSWAPMPIGKEGRYFPVGGMKTRDCDDGVGRVFCVGPVRNSTPSNWLVAMPVVVIRDVPPTATMRDLVHSYFHYQDSGSSLDIDKCRYPDSLFYDNTEYSMDSKVRAIFTDKPSPGLQKFYLAFPNNFSIKEDSRDIDSLLGFIEGCAEGENKSKKKKKKNSSNKTLAVSEEQKEEHLEDEMNEDLIQSSDDMFESISSDNEITESRSEQDAGFSEIATQTRVPGETILSDAISVRVKEELETKKFKLTALQTAKNELENSLAKESLLLKDHLASTTLLEETKMTEVKEITLIIENNVSNKNQNNDRISQIDSAVRDIKLKLNELKEERRNILALTENFYASKEKLEKKKERISCFLSKELEKASEERAKIGESQALIQTEIAAKITQIRNLASEPVIQDAVVTNTNISTQKQNEQLIRFIDRQIIEKEAELECPVCLETAAAPIFMCSEQHLICSLCR